VSKELKILAGKREVVYGVGEVPYTYSQVSFIGKTVPDFLFQVTSI
jgi:hypothetical protein